MLLLHSRVQADGEGELTDVTTVARIRGGVSGGTIDSHARAGRRRAGRPRRSGALMRDPYGLSPERDAEPDTRQPSDNPAPHRVDGRWVAPFVMASYNTRIVRRSNAIAGYAYGKGLRYGEVMGTGKGPIGAVTAGVVTGGLGALLAGFVTPGVRQVLDRVLPQPGEGPSEKTREHGWFRHDIDATTTTGARYTGRVSGSGDPGYAATAVMLGETRALPRPRRRPPARPRRLAHPRHGDGPGARGAPAHRRPRVRRQQGLNASPASTLAPSARKSASIMSGTTPRPSADLAARPSR